ncbi:MAG: hypothetical protein GY856_50890 [bacterium]|nr:hypothetical protein [bacterium]
MIDAVLDTSVLVDLLRGFQALPTIVDAYVFFPPEILASHLRSACQVRRPAASRSNKAFVLLRTSV